MKIHFRSLKMYCYQNEIKFYIHVPVIDSEVPIANHYVYYVNLCLCPPPLIE